MMSSLCSSNCTSTGRPSAMTATPVQPVALRYADATHAVSRAAQWLVVRRPGLDPKSEPKTDRTTASRTELPPSTKAKLPQLL